jgi:glycosyltransferase involved in cell wall biosynthesis
MKVLFLIHQFYPEWHSGTEKVTLSLASMMQKLDYKVKIISYSFYNRSDYNTKPGKVLLKEGIYKSIPVLDYQLDLYLDNIHFDLFVDDKNELFLAAEKILIQEKPDLVHITHTMRGSIFVKALIKYKIPYILTLTDFYLICPKTFLINSAMALCSGPESGSECTKGCPELSGDFITKRLNSAREILFNAKKIIVPSPFVASIYKREFGNLEFLVIPHGLNYRYIRKNRKEYAKGDKIVFTYTGTFSQHKGIDILIRAFQRLKSDDSILKLYGRSDEGSFSQKVLKQTKSDSRIQLCGVYKEDQLSDILRDSDVVIIPSITYESYSLILHEALASEVPVIVSDVPALNQIIKDPDNGFVFAKGDVLHLTEIMQQIVENPVILNQLKRNISRMSINTIEQEACLYEKVYELACHP